MSPDELARVLWTQDGVVARRQLTELGFAPHDVRRLLRRRELVPVHPGVYVDHTGPLTWPQRAQAAVRAAWPAALVGRSALPDPPRSAAIEVGVARGRWVPRLRGVVVTSQADLDERVDWRKSPPRLRIEHATLQLASGDADGGAMFRTLADACQTRETSPQRLAEALDRYRRLPQARLIGAMVDDLAAGACSVLEREYLTRVERAHGLPVADRQVADRTSAGRCDRDVLYRRYSLVVELDGRAFHDTAGQRDADLERDLVAAVERGAVTVRIGYGQVFSRACRTAYLVAALLARGGWGGRPRRCPRCP